MPSTDKKNVSFTLKLVPDVCMHNNTRKRNVKWNDIWDIANNPDINMHKVFVQFYRQYDELFHQMIFSLSYMLNAQCSLCHLIYSFRMNQMIVSEHTPNQQRKFSYFSSAMYLTWMVTYSPSI